MCRLGSFKTERRSVFKVDSFPLLLIWLENILLFFGAERKKGFLCSRVTFDTKGKFFMEGRKIGERSERIKYFNQLTHMLPPEK